MTRPALPIRKKLESCCEIDLATGCWNWTAYKQKVMGSKTDGSNRQELAHRVSFEHFVRPLAAGECVLHKCDHPSCINPDHLYAGTQVENMRDMAVRGRRKGIVAVRGSRHGLSKLTEDQVIAIRKSQAPRSTLAIKFGITASHVSTIRRRVGWLHVPETST